MAWHMHRWRMKTYSALCLLASPIFLFVACPVFFFLCREAPHPLLMRSIDRLTRENDKLHQDIRTLSQELKRKVAGPGSIEHAWSRSYHTSEHLGRDAIEERQNGSVSREGLEGVTREDCDTIHIAMVAAGYSTARSVVTLIKSILFYRLNPLHFHFVTDSSANQVLSTVFRTWQLPAVKVSFYAIKSASDAVSWIPNSHYSGIYGLMKLTLVKMLPESLDQVIVLDTDLMLMENVASLWKFFSEIRRRRKLLGVVENQSDWYLGNLWEKQKPWPAVGRGFNTGVMLLNLKLMREEDWVYTP